MKKSLLILLSLILSVCVVAQIEKAIPAKPDPPKLVNDFTGNFLTPAQKEALENKLKVYDDSTSNQFTVVIVSSLDGYEPNEYAVALGRKWGVGNKDFNNGVVILISTGGNGEKRKAYIATGYGLEGAIPDVTCKRIVDNEIVPNFKEGNYYRGLDAATDALIKAAAGEYTAPANYGSKKKGKLPIGTIIFIVIILLVIFGGGAAGGGGTYVSRGGFTGWSGGGGGGWSGGGGGSSSGGGSFGGFGGGSFGGGGAGGDW